MPFYIENNKSMLFCLLARSSKSNRSRLARPAVELAPDAVIRCTTNAAEVTVRCSCIVALDGLASYEDTAYNVSPILLDRFI